MPTTPIPRATVTVFGAGVAGMTAAHELAVRGFSVTVVERLREDRLSDRPGRDCDYRAGEAGEEVIVGGLAASQFARGPAARTFPHEPKDRPDDLELMGEHGYRFFPSYYRHLFDSMQRTPVYDEHGNQTRFTTYDNVLPCPTQATASTPTHPLMVIPRDPTTSPLVGAVPSSPHDGDGAPQDMLFVTERMLQFMTSSSERRRIYEQISSYDFFVGIDEPGAPATIVYSPETDHQLKVMPKVLVAFDAQYGDARTNLDNWTQMMLNWFAKLPKTDGILNGPTTTAWLDHWRCLLMTLDVTFVAGRLKSLKISKGRVVPKVDWSGDAPSGIDDHVRDSDYIVVATDVVAAEKVTRQLPQVGVPRGLAGYTTTVPPKRSPGDWKHRHHHDHHDRRHDHHDHDDHHDDKHRRTRNPYKEAGMTEWDRLQNFSGIQFFFDTEFEMLHGRVYFGDSEWGLSSVSQTSFWVDRPTVVDNGYAAIVSVDIGEEHVKSSHTGKTLMESGEDEIAVEIWRQMVDDLASGHELHDMERILPAPRWYMIDRNLVFRKDGRGVKKNMAPYLVPILDDWDNRPGAEPWRPGGPACRSRHLDRDVWQAGHGGAWVHFDSLVFAGTYLKTFTRLTTMESANESARHAVNGILDHWLHENSPGRSDRRDESGLNWLVPYGYVDEQNSTPVRQPTPAGDYCMISDMEDNELADLQPIKDLDAEFFKAGLPHPFVLSGLEAGTAITSQLLAMLTEGLSMKYPAPDDLVEMLREYRHFLEDLLEGRPGRAHWRHHQNHHRHSGHGYEWQKGLEDLYPLLSRLFSP